MNSLRLGVYSLFLFLLLFVASPRAAERESDDVIVQNTVTVFFKIPGLTPHEREQGKRMIQRMDYNSQRIIRKISQLPGANFVLSQQAWEVLQQKDLAFEQVLAFEQWAALRGATMPKALEVLSAIKAMNREQLRTFRASLAMRGMQADLALRLIAVLRNLDEANILAVRGLFSVRGMDAKEAVDGLAIIRQYNKKQAWSYAAFTGVPNLGYEVALDALPFFRQLREEDAWNMQFFIKLKKPDSNTAWTWLIRYFAHPVHVQEQQYYQMSALNRSALLDSMYHAGEELVWRINNLHDITDDYGVEISQGRLMALSAEAMQALFNRLSEKTRVNYSGAFTSARRAGQQGNMIRVLRQATSADRRQVSEDLTSANIYALMAQGSELYDSSFRDVLVPILNRRIRQEHRDNLLVFLQATDPSNLLVSNFIVSLAQKGKLTTFFPESAVEQQRILDLVAESAFKDEDSILLFSATFRYLLTVLEPTARHYLIQKMVGKDQGQDTFSRLIRVILQYYLQEYSRLLDEPSKELIQRNIARNGSVDINRYLATPFAQWKEDRRLGSISIFHPDDDGRSSFISNAQTLNRHGYQLQLSEQYTFADNKAQRQRFEGIIQRVRSTQNFGTLYEAMRKEPFSAAFVKKVNGITIHHSVHVYGDKEMQQQIILRFLQGKDEMFAQRGHSYWRSEQIIDPILQLQEGEQISKEDLTVRQRFLSLGSCGGVKVYTKLTKMFHGHIDLLATIGTGVAVINDPYNLHFFEIVANNPSSMTWEDMTKRTSFIFSGGRGQDYLQPGGLTAILHKMLYEEEQKSQKADL
jgi:hypothetical protein